MSLKIVWEDLPKKKAFFIIRNTAMVSLDTKKPIQLYSANTRINLVQKATYNDITYYRTATARDKGLNWVFRAADFGLPNDEAPLAPPTPKSSLHTFEHTKTEKKQKTKKKDTASKSGEKWWKKFFKK